MSVESRSPGSCITEGDLEEARQRLLEHQSDHVYHTEPIDEVEPTLSAPFRAGLPPAALRDGNYGSVTTLQSIQQKPAPRIKRYRIPFLILLAFDFGMVIFLYIICSEWHGKKSVNVPYFTYNLRAGFFDLVTLATIRVVFSVLFYLVLGWITRIVMGVVTIVSACFVPIKAYYAWDNISGADVLEAIAVLLMLFVSFVLPWCTAFFFEFKYLPAEISRLDIRTWWDYRPWLWPRALVKQQQPGENPPSLPAVVETPRPAFNPSRRTGSALSLDFRTPLGSSRTSPVVAIDRYGDDDLPAIPEEVVGDQLPSEDARFKEEGQAALEDLKNLVRNDDDWTLERSTDGISIYVKSGPSRKIWRGEIVLNISAKHLWDILYPGDQTPEWNPQCGLNETIYRIDDNTDVAYTVSNPIGPISSRDFVSIRQIAAQDGCYYSASQATTTTLKPEQPGKVRAENGPCGYVVIPIEPRRTKFIWIINSNLKGWLPQTVIDQGLSGALVAGLKKLQTYILDH